MGDLRCSFFSPFQHHSGGFEHQQPDEERLSRRIARRLKAEGPWDDGGRGTAALAYAVAGCYPPKQRHGRIHAATRSFQALRIAVNDELGVLETLLNEAPNWLEPGGRIAVISFHSLEDRITKQFIEKLANPKSQQDARLRKLPLPEPTPLMKKLDRIKPTKEECELNPRSRSSVLRVAEKLAEWPASSSAGGGTWGA